MFLACTLHRYNRCDTSGHRWWVLLPQVTICHHLGENSRFFRDRFSTGHSRHDRPDQVVNATSLSLRPGGIHQIFTLISVKGKMSSLGIFGVRYLANAAESSFRVLFPGQANFRQSVCGTSRTMVFLSYIGKSSLIGTKRMLRFRVLVY